MRNRGGRASLPRGRCLAAGVRQGRVDRTQARGFYRLGNAAPNKPQLELGFRVGGCNGRDPHAHRSGEAARENKHRDAVADTDAESPHGNDSNREEGAQRLTRRGPPVSASAARGGVRRGFLGQRA